MLTVAYMGGGGCQKWPKTCLRNLRMAPKETVRANLRLETNRKKSAIFV